MDGQSGARWAALAGLAAEQHGVVALWQLYGLGLPRGWIEHKLRAGRLHPVYRGVYAVGYPGRSALGGTMAAVLACGREAKLSHWSAVRHWGLLQTNRAVVDVVASGNRPGPKGIHVHRCKLMPDEWTRRDGIPVTTIPRTLLDIAPSANQRQLRRATNAAARLGWLNARVINDLLARHRGRAGIAAFRAAIAAVSPETRRTRSDLEDYFLQTCRRYSLPTPIVNATIEGFEVDFYFPGTSLIVELDSYEYHRTPHEFDYDRRRDAHLKKKRYEVLRVSEMWLDSDPGGVADTVRELLRRRALPRA
jgi:very-short-patch-repair endonuclease/predicted transcriptional regulator of viral defense system